jgi:zinc/manganese transport system permease protein
MAVGLMMLPALCARFWAREVASMAGVAIGVAFASGYLGLLVSYHFRAPSGPSIVLVAAAVYGLSIVFGRHGGLLTGVVRRRHFHR